MSRNSAYAIKEDISTWLYDQLPLTQDLKGNMEKPMPAEILCKTLGLKYSIDYAYPLGNNAVLVVSMRDRTLIVYNYKTHSCGKPFSLKPTDVWIDVICLPVLQERGAEKYTNQATIDSVLIYVLTNKGRIFKFHTELTNRSSPFMHYDIVMDYCATISTLHPATKILPCRITETPYGKDAVDTLFLWLPSKRLLQKYSLFDIKGSDSPVPRLGAEIKLKYPHEFADGNVQAKNTEALSLYLDEIAQSVIVADAFKRIVFEFSLTEKNSQLICSFCEDPSETNLMVGPTFPLILRPQDYVQRSMLSDFSQQALRSDATGVLPRMLLIFFQNQLLKIWQFPDSPALLLDLSGETIVSTLMGKDPEAMRKSEKNTLIESGFGSFRAMSIGSLGQLAVVTDEAVYLLFSGVSSGESEVLNTAGVEEVS